MLIFCYLKKQLYLCFYRYQKNIKMISFFKKCPYALYLILINTSVLVNKNNLLERDAGAST